MLRILCAVRTFRWPAEGSDAAEGAAKSGKKRGKAVARGTGAAVADGAAASGAEPAQKRARRKSK